MEGGYCGALPNFTRLYVGFTKLAIGHGGRGLEALGGLPAEGELRPEARRFGVRGLGGVDVSAGALGLANIVVAR